MRIALVTHKFTKGDGQGRVNYEIARAALEAGHCVWLIASDIAPELAAHSMAQTVRVGVAGWPSALIQNQVFAVKSALWINRNRHQLDLVHVNGFITWARADVNTAHFVHAAWLQSPVHTSRIRRDCYGLYQWIYSWVNSVLERWAYRRASVVIAVSNQVKRELVSAGLPAEQVQVVPNGVDLVEFKPAPVRREALGLPEGVLLLFVGDIRTPRKNLDTLLRALTLVRVGTLVVVGSVIGSPYPRLADRLGVAERVMFLGYRKDVPLLMRAADVFVFPSRYEACSLVLLEALASGLPVVAARTTGGSELLTPQCSVLIGDADDVSALASALDGLVASVDVRAQMRAAARKVADSLSWTNMAERYLEIYRECSRGSIASQCKSATP
jgi:glycosyltransferase involved in cell wall biosynthesis